MMPTVSIVLLALVSFAAVVDHVDSVEDVGSELLDDLDLFYCQCIFGDDTGKCVQSARSLVDACKAKNQLALCKTEADLLIDQCVGVEQQQQQQNQQEDQQEQQEVQQQQQQQQNDQQTCDFLACTAAADKFNSGPVSKKVKPNPLLTISDDLA